jgi:hypothetical protein
LNKHITESNIQAYILEHLHADVHQIAMAKSPFPEVSGKELSVQIAAKRKSARKLPTWYNTPGVYFPPLLSVEQCSSETTAAYKASLVLGSTLVDLTGGFGVDSFYFSKVCPAVLHIEINNELSEIASYNALPLRQSGTTFLCDDGIAYLQRTTEHFGAVYIDPARRSTSGKVFMLKDCSPNVIEHLDLLLSRTTRLLIKTAPLLDLSAGLKELNHVSQIHIVSVRNECKELIWVVEQDFSGIPEIICTTLNTEKKEFRFTMGDEPPGAFEGSIEPGMYLYEPDVALLKGGAFNLIAKRYGLLKLHPQTQLYTSSRILSEFPGRIFLIEEVLSAAAIKKDKNLQASVIVRNYPDKAAALVSKYQIKPDDSQFLVFTQSKTNGKLIIKAEIVQHY